MVSIAMQSSIICIVSTTRRLAPFCQRVTEFTLTLQDKCTESSLIPLSVLCKLNNHLSLTAWAGSEAPPSAFRFH